MRRLSPEEKARLLQAARENPAPEAGEDASLTSPPDPWTDFRTHPGYQQLRLLQEGGRRLGVDTPFFRLHEGSASRHSRIAGRQVLNFSSYNYLGLAGHPEVSAAARNAIDQYGTSVSASRIVSGERPFHRELERGLAAHYGVDDALALVSGHATNLSVLGHLLGPRDLVLHDAYAHNSLVLGARLSGARRIAFAHNDLAALEAQLRLHRRSAERALIAVEGIYSMDGDFPDLPRLLELKRRYRAWLMVDEAHSLGVAGPDGGGLASHFGVEPRETDIWMGTLSKTLASCGGYIAGCQALVDNLRHLAPGFLYSVGITPPASAAAAAALHILHREPERVQRLQASGRRLLAGLQGLGLDTGGSHGLAVIPWIVGSSVRAVQYSDALLEQGICVQPILYPAVPESRARLRFFLNSAHTVEDTDDTVKAIARLLPER